MGSSDSKAGALLYTEMSYEVWNIDNKETVLKQRIYQYVITHLVLFSCFVFCCYNESSATENKSILSSLY